MERRIGQDFQNAEKERERERQKTERIRAERALGKIISVTWISRVYVTFFLLLFDFQKWELARF